MESNVLFIHSENLYGASSRDLLRGSTFSIIAIYNSLDQGSLSVAISPKGVHSTWKGQGLGTHAAEQLMCLQVDQQLTTRRGRKCSRAQQNEDSSARSPQVCQSNANGAMPDQCCCSVADSLQDNIKV